MSRDTIWSNSDGLSVGFGTRDVTHSASYMLVDDGPFQKLYFRFRGQDVPATVAATDEQLMYAPFIPNGATIVSATLTVIEAFAGATATLNIGLYDSAGAAVDADGIDATIAVTAIDAIGDTVTCDGAVVKTVVATSGGVRVACDYDTAAFTAGDGILEVTFITSK